MPQTAPSVRVVVRLPWNRPDHALPDPPRIEWTPEKADILWRVIEKSRSSDSGGADWKGLAAHLEVPLPYLLYRVNARFQEEIRGLKDIQGALSPSATNPTFEESMQADRPPLAIHTGVSGSKLSTSSRTNTPRNVRARLSSLVNNSPRPKKAISSSTITVRGVKRQPVSLRQQSPSSSEDSLSEDDEAVLKEEEAERIAEEQVSLDRKLEELSRLITSDTLGLVRTHRSKRSSDRGRAGNLSTSTNAHSASGSFRGDSLSSRSDNQSLSSVSSPQGSIPEIPSPATDSQPHSPMHLSQHMSPVKSSSPAAISPKSASSHSHNRKFNPPVGDQGSGHVSEASSFSDLSDASLSASALESALMSNIAGMRSTPGTSRQSIQFPSRSRTINNTFNPL